VASVASLTVQMGAQSADTIDLTYLWNPTDGRTVRIPWAQRAGTPPNLSVFPFIPYPRNLGFLATLTYVGGPCAGTTLDSVPFPIREATYLIVMDRLGFRKNPTGAAMVRLGDSMLETRLRGDTSGKSILRLQAEDYLGPYVYK
jgi:hypothetical protein